MEWDKVATRDLKPCFEPVNLYDNVDEETAAKLSRIQQRDEIQYNVLEDHNPTDFHLEVS